MSVILVFSVVPFGSFCVFAQESTAEIVYNTDNGVLTVSPAEGKTNVKIPDYGLNSTAPWGNEYTSLVVSEGITEIGDYAFYNSLNCTSVSLPNGLKRIGKYAFFGGNINSLTIPDTVTKIGRYAFLNCRNLQEVTLSSNLSEISDYMFSNCVELKTVRIPTSVTRIGNNAFINCAKLESVAIPNTVTEIDTCAFKECSNLKNIEIPDNVTEIKKDTFSRCTELESVKLPKNLKKIGKNAFFACGIISITIPEKAEDICDYAFSFCVSLESITFSGTLKSLGYGAFSDCVKLKSIVIPKGIERIDGYTFAQCSELSEVDLPSGLREISGSAFVSTTALKSITLPESLEIIESYAFSQSGLTSITLPKNLQEVESNAFFYCENLSKISILSENLRLQNNVFPNTAYVNNTENYEDGVLYIDNYLISGKDYTGGDNDGKYVVKDGTVGIAKSAFEECKNIKSVTLPDSIKNIGKTAFQYCSELNSIVLPDTAFEHYSDSFRYTGYYNNTENYSDGVLYIGKHLISIDKINVNSNMIESFTVKEGTITVADEMFSDFKKLKTLYLPESLALIMSYALDNLQNLETVTIDPDNENYKVDGNCVINIKRKTLIKALNDAAIPSDGSVETIAEEAFKYSKTTNVEIPESVVKIGDNAFAENKNIENIVLTSGVASIAEDSFYNCDNVVFYVNDNAYAEKYVKDHSLFLGKGNIQNPQYATAYKDDIKYTVCGSALIISGTTELFSIYYMPEIITDIVIEDGIIGINRGAFSRYPLLSTLVIPESCLNFGIELVGDASKVTIVTKEDSAAQIYATANGYKFTPLCDLHSFNTEKTFNAATCISEGKGLLDCENCHYKKIDKIEKNSNHTGTTSIINSKKATFSEDGHTQHTKCNSCGEISKYGTVIPKVYDVKLSATSYTFDGKAKKPTVTVKDSNGKVLKLNTDYTLGYSNNTKAGKASVKVTLKGNYSGTKTLNFTIKAKKITPTVSGYTAKVYNGKAQTQNLTVKYGKTTLKKGTDYTVTYSNNKYVGKASVKVTLKGNYTGTKTVTFNINPKSTTLKSLTAGKKQITAKWNKQATQTTGYQIQYSTSSAFKNAKTVTVTSNKTTSKIVKNLSGGKKYYVRVRTYKTVKNTKYYSAWSAKKSATAKKK